MGVSSAALSPLEVAGAIGWRRDLHKCVALFRGSGTAYSGDPAKYEWDLWKLAKPTGSDWMRQLENAKRRQAKKMVRTHAASVGAQGTALAIEGVPA